MWRWTAALAGLAVLGFALVMAVVVTPVRVRAAVATVDTHASATISADTAGVAPGSAVYTTLTGPVIQEGAVGDVAIGTIILDAPAAFEFNPTATVTVSVSPTTTNATKIAAPGGCAGGGSSSATATPAADKITIEVCAASTSTTVSKLTWSGIKVRPKTGPAAPVTQNITYSGTGSINGITALVTPLGVLAEVNGTPATIVLTPPGVVTGPVDTTLGPWSAAVTDQFSNPAVGAPVYWSITSFPTGATCQQLIGAEASTDGGGLGIATTSLMLGNQNGSYQLTVSSTGLASATNSVATATGGPGAPCAPVVTPTFTPTSTPIFTATPIVASGYNRFYGSVTLNGSLATAGTIVSATINGTLCAQTTVDASGNYTIDVPSSSITANCGTAGVTVNFTVGGYAASSSGTWYTGNITNLPLAASSTATVTPIPTSTAIGAATATPTTGPLTTVSLVAGCNPVASTYPNGTSVTTIAAAVSPASALISVWAFQNSTWLGYSPQFPTVSQTFNVDRLGVVFICVGSAATWSRPIV